MVHGQDLCLLADFVLTQSFILGPLDVFNQSFSLHLSPPSCSHKQGAVARPGGAGPRHETGGWPESCHYLLHGDERDVAHWGRREHRHRQEMKPEILLFKSIC